MDAIFGPRSSYLRVSSSGGSDEPGAERTYKAPPQDNRACIGRQDKSPASISSYLQLATTSRCCYRYLLDLCRSSDSAEAWKEAQEVGQHSTRHARRHAHVLEFHRSAVGSGIDGGQVLGRSTPWQVGAHRARPPGGPRRPRPRGAPMIATCREGWFALRPRTPERFVPQLRTPPAWGSWDWPWALAVPPCPPPEGRARAVQNACRRAR